MKWKHMIIEGKITGKLSSEEDIKEFLKNVTVFTDVRILYGPVVVRGLKHNDGYTGFVIVDYSHISLHTYFENNYCALDIFTCKDFDTKKILNLIKNYIHNPKYVEFNRPFNL